MSFGEIIEKSKELSIAELKKLFGVFLRDVNYYSIFCRNQTFEGLYRARQHNQIDGENDNYLFINEKEYWNPDPSYIKKMGRCNDIGESLFYCSNEFETAILEIRPQVGRFVSVANFRPLGNNFPGFKIKPIGIQYLKKIKGFESCTSKFDLSQRNQFFLYVDNLLDTLFTEVVDDDEKFKYKITNAITQCMLTDIVNHNQEVFMMDGMVYPSIVNKRRSVNILLKPINLIANYLIKSIQTFEIVDVASNTVTIRLVRDGRIKGIRNNPSQRLDVEWYTVRDGESYTFEF